jgi:hypothetical protein
MEAYDKLVGTKTEYASKLEEAKLGLNISQGGIDDSTHAKIVYVTTGILCISESQHECDPWTITSAQTNGTRFNADKNQNN